PVTGVTLDRTAATLAPGATLRLNATVNPAGATNRTVTWTSSQGTFATVDQSGLVTAHAGPGATRITVTTADGSFTAYCDVTVTASATYPFALNTHAVTLNAAQYVQLSLTYPQAYPAVTWHSENENIAIVSATGRVAALAEGTTRIYAEDLTQPNRSDYCTVTVQPAIVQNPFELNTHSLTLDVAESVQLRLTAPEQYTVTWRTVDEDVAIVSSTGRVIGVGAGTTQVIAEDRSRGKSDACTVTVRAQASHRTVSLSHTMLILNEGQRTAIRATVTPAGATVAWSSANASIADVTPTGTVIALMSGNTNITASLPDGTSATCNVTVRDIDLAADVLDIEPHAATLAFPRLSGTAYYLVHLFEVSAAGDRIPEIALKVNPDGSIANIIGLRASPVSISLTVNGLRASTAYEADIDVIREINGTDEAVTTMTVTFTTAESPTANAPAAASLAPQAWYAAGALRLTNLDGHRVEIYTPSGRTVAVLTVATPDETHRHPFPPGLYILRATTPTTRTTLKFIVP
ncbi:MAG: Ig-like domain-containing protein, partial [Tannerella sp.]|nr:Ig-like domain-containing protein [Tannerella sp.]